MCSSPVRWSTAWCASTSATLAQSSQRRLVFFEAGFAGRFSSDVAALDAGLQLVLLWARHRTGGAFLPTRVGALTLHQGALPEGLLTCVVEAKASLGSADIRAVADVHFIDSRGVQVCSMTDVVAHRLQDDDAFGSLGPSDVVMTAPAGAAE